MRKHFADNYFFAVVPDSETAKQLALFAADFKRDMGLRGSLIPAERLHISLCRISYLTPNIRAALRESAERIEMQPFQVMFKHLMSFDRTSRDRPLVLCEDDHDREGTLGLHQLYRAIPKVMAEAGLHHVRLRKKIEPHVTLLYGEHDLTKREIKRFSWRVEKLMLIHSLVGLGEYRVIDEWKLRGSIPTVPRSELQAPFLLRPVAPYANSEDAAYNDE